MWSDNILGLKIFKSDWSEKNLSLKILQLKHVVQTFWVRNFFGVKIKIWLKKTLVVNFCWSDNFRVQTLFCVNIFMSEKILFRNMLGSEKMLGLKRYWVLKFLDQKKIGSGKILCLKNDHPVKNKCRLRKVGK